MVLKLLAGWYWAWLLLVHGAWLWCWSAIGTAPRYGAPKSWKVPPLSEFRLFYSVSALVLVVSMFMLPVAAIGAGWAVRRARWDRQAILFALLACMAGLMLWIDPFGASFW